MCIWFCLPRTSTTLFLTFWMTCISEKRGAHSPQLLCGLVPALWPLSQSTRGSQLVTESLRTFHRDDAQQGVSIPGMMHHLMAHTQWQNALQAVPVVWKWEHFGCLAYLGFFPILTLILQPSSDDPLSYLLSLY